MQKIKIHPAFLVLIVVLIIFGKFEEILSSIVAVSLHEFAHYQIAKGRGYRLFELNVMPYGAVLYGNENIKPSDEKVISIAGPLSNFLIAIFITALWWIFPTTYLYTLKFFRINIGIGLFNLLPVYPLDGSKFVLSMSKNRLKTIGFLKSMGIILSLCFFAFFIFTAFYEINFTYGIIAILLFIGAFSSIEKERYIHICNQLFYIKDFSHPIEKKCLLVKEDLEISKIIKNMKPFAIYDINVVDSNLKTIKKLKEKELENILMVASPKDKIGCLIKNSK